MRNKSIINDNDNESINNNDIIMMKIMILKWYYDNSND